MWKKCENFNDISNQAGQSLRIVIIE